MTRTLAHAVCGFLLVATAVAVLTAGPLTANAAVRLIDHARLFTALAIAL